MVWELLRMKNVLDLADGMRKQKGDRQSRLRRDMAWLIAVVREEDKVQMVLVASRTRT